MLTEANSAIDEGRDLALHLYDEADKLLASWAAFSSSNDPLLKRRQVTDTSVASAHRQLVLACFRDAQMTLGRMTDPPSRFSLFRATDLLERPHVVENLRGAYGCKAFERSLRLLREKARWDPSIKMASAWEESKPLFERPFSLMQFRAEHYRFRNALFAHSSDKTIIGGMWIPRYDRMVALCVWATVATMFVFRGIPWNPRMLFRQYCCGQQRLLSELR